MGSSLLGKTSCQGECFDPFLQDWKSGRNLIGAAAFKVEPSSSEQDEAAAEAPSFHLAVMDESQGMTLADAIREKWASDDLRKVEWARAIAQFDQMPPGQFRNIFNPCVQDCQPCFVSSTAFHSK